ncbi:type II inositol 1,4,5-trisphosphate 5-phosphatase isoform X3 [Pantherophis guttatus]|uniref:phosphoinositide 5-phosphatase n=1 Tax=Pantherophis guttatus TaxID=94885 RepID=A0ABM3ZGB7_PANGU|nr:type II inositol 1,4,5-trisphosphate 5-phosphatase isoform X3 [Pantherophis guttatus]
MDQSGVVQEALAAGQTCLAAVQGTLVVGQASLESRLLGLVESGGRCLVCLYTHRRMAIAAEDLCLERVLRLEEGFALEEVAMETELPTLGSDVTIRIVSPEANLLVRLPFGSQTQMFLREVRKRCVAGGTVLKPAWPAGRSDHASSQGCSVFPGIAGKEDLPPEGETWPGRSKGQSVPGGAPRPSKTHREETPNVLASSETLGQRRPTLKSQLLQKEDLYTSLCHFKFFVGSYNVNGRAPQESLLPWLSHDADPPDVYCVGFQALDLSQEAAMFNDTPREEEWFEAVTKSLHPRAKYAKIKVVWHVGILLLLCMRRELAANVSDVCGVTVGSLGGTDIKGAVAIRFRFHSTTICVANAHLTAHPPESEQYSQDIRDICARLQFFQQDPSLPTIPLSQHDIVVWLGDLNSQLEQQNMDQVKKLVEAQEFRALYRHDQLRSQMEAKRVFEDFTEGEVIFQPTYKYKISSDEWDTSEQYCAFAWCDRILFKGETISQLDYRNHLTLRNSDHKPVSAVFDIAVKVVDEQLYRKVFGETVSSMDKRENASIPSVTLSKREFFFRDVKFMQLQMDVLIICNGPTPCQFEFICKPHESSYCKPWLTAKPSKGFLLSDDEVTIELEVFVNKSTATHLNSGEDQLEDVLVLHLHRGKDYFLPVTGNYCPSCFGTPIHALIHMRQPIQDILPETIRKLTLMPLQSGEDFFWDEKPLDVPKELWMMVDHLYHNACQKKDLFQQPGPRAEFPEIRDCLDTGTLDTLVGSSCSVAEVLLLFLESLPEPVICFQLYDRSVESAGSYGLSSQVVSMLPRCHKNVFNYLMAFLRELLQHSEKNHLDGHILASVFGPVLLRPPPGHPAPDTVEKQKAQQFLQHFLFQEGSSP